MKFVCMHACSATKSCEVFGICEVVFEPHQFYRFFVKFLGVVKFVNYLLNLYYSYVKFLSY